MPLTLDQLDQALATLQEVRLTLAGPSEVPPVRTDKEAPPSDVVPPSDSSKPRSTLQTVLSSVKGLWQSDIKASDQTDPAGVTFDRPLVFFQTKEGRTRWIALVTNNFQDREKEIIPEAVHQEYVDWAVKEKALPELWLWHAGPDSRWGEADFLGMSDGFVVASGLVDVGKEYIAENLQGEDLGVSHGSLAAKALGGVWSKYRGFEISPLPRRAAANEWTAFTLHSPQEVKEVTTMPFTKEKREWLIQQTGLGTAQIDALEASTATMQESLKAKKIEWKDLDPTLESPSELALLKKELADLKSLVVDLNAKAKASDDKGSKNPMTDDSPAEEAAESEAEKKYEAKKTKKEVTAPLEADNVSAQAVAELAAVVKSLQSDLAAVKATANQTRTSIAEDLFMAKVVPGLRGGPVHEASSSNGNVTDQLKTKDTETGKKDTDWFGDTILAGIAVK